MGFRFRKSFGRGPFRVTISPTGVSTSVGVKGARVTSGPRGTRLTVGGGGISYSERLKAPAASAQSSTGPPPVQVGGGFGKLIAFVLIIPLAGIVILVLAVTLSNSVHSDRTADAVTSKARQAVRAEAEKQHARVAEEADALALTSTITAEPTASDLSTIDPAPSTRTAGPHVSTFADHVESTRTNAIFVLDPTTMLFHSATCPDAPKTTAHVIRTAATMQGYRPHSCAIAPNKAN
jgi:hypothetical protein